MKKMVLILIIIILALLSSCEQKPIEELPGEDLFTLKIGKMEDQFDIFMMDGTSLRRKNRFIMKNGIFYIANGNSSKVMKFTSYGDLLLLIYNPDTNPRPFVLDTEEQEGVITNRPAETADLLNIGEIAIDSENTIYLEDQVPPEQAVKDEKLEINLTSRIYRYNRLGRLVDFIGQEGTGGTPFPYIQRIHITEKDELVAICRIYDQWNVYWYAKNGNPLLNITIDTRLLPKESNLIPSLENLVPDFTEYALYLKINYSREEIDPSTETKETIKDAFSRIYKYNITTRKYEHYVETPDNETKKIISGNKEVEIPAPSYEFLGVDIKGSYYLIRPDTENKFKVLIIDNAGKTRVTRLISVDDSELYFKMFHLSDKGIISGILCYQDEVKVMWWRTDRLITGKKNENN
ncbi:MAG: hypothetical protein JW969_18740 [Spirochaetales bacterium]|nr:hypothetical protein [Spirochaetales bacterium]